MIYSQIVTKMELYSSKTAGCVFLAKGVESQPLRERTFMILREIKYYSSPIRLKI